MPTSPPPAARSRRDAHPLFRREMRERWRRPLTLLQLGLFALIVSWLGYNVYTTVVPLGDWLAADSLLGVGQRFFFDVARWHALAWVPGGVLLAAPTLAAERERGHLTEWVLAGLSPAGIVRAKFRALAGFVLVMACVPFPVFALCFALGGVSPLDFLATGALTIAIALNCAAFGVLVSASARTVTGALVSGLFTALGLLMLAVPLLYLLLDGPWFGSLLMAIIFAFTPILWVGIAAETFEQEVEEHVKGDRDFDNITRAADAQRWLVDSRGQVIAPPGSRPQPATSATPDARPILAGQSEQRAVELSNLPAPANVKPVGANAPAARANVVLAVAQSARTHAHRARESADKRAAMSGRKRLADEDGAPDGHSEDYTEAEVWMLLWARDNAITQRDLRRRFRERRANAGETADADWPLAVWIAIWVALGGVGWALGAAFPRAFLGCAFVVLLPAMSYAALGAAPGFTRERAQKMLSALQMTALSPRDIVVGKVAGVLLGCAHWFGGPLLALSVMALRSGPWSALAMLSLGAMCVVFTATGSLTLSLWSRKTEIVALGALSAIAGLWWVLPTLFINNEFSLFFRAPLWLDRLWLAPMRTVLQPRGDLNLASGLLQLAALCAAGAGVMGWACVAQLRRTRAEEEATGLLQRDLSRGWH